MASVCRTDARNAIIASDDQELLARHVGRVVEHVEAPGPACDPAVVSGPEDRPTDVRAESGNGALVRLQVEDPGWPVPSARTRRWHRPARARAFSRTPVSPPTRPPGQPSPSTAAAPLRPSSHFLHGLAKGLIAIPLRWCQRCEASLTIDDDQRLQPCEPMGDASSRAARGGVGEPPLDRRGRQPGHATRIERDLGGTSSAVARPPPRPD
jgi:hypothetical protein